jgi:branched-chain amino acid transport system permease protein
VFFGFAVALIGGLGNAPGAVLAAVTLGIAQQLFERYVSPSASGAYVLALMILILLVRPNGLLRGSEGSRVA